MRIGTTEGCAPSRGVAPQRHLHFCAFCDRWLPSWGVDRDALAVKLARGAGEQTDPGPRRPRGAGGDRTMRCGPIKAAHTLWFLTMFCCLQASTSAGVLPGTSGDQPHPPVPGRSVCISEGGCSSGGQCPRHSASSSGPAGLQLTRACCFSQRVPQGNTTPVFLPFHRRRTRS